MKRIAILLAALLLAACAGEEQQELKQWMRDSAKNLKGRVPPLPPVKPYEPFTYAANDLPDPFKPSKIDPDAGKPTQSAKKGGLQPDFNRKKEPLDPIDVASYLPEIIERLAMDLNARLHQAASACPRSDADAIPAVTPQELEHLKSLGCIR